MIGTQASMMVAERIASVLSAAFSWASMDISLSTLMDSVTIS